jgi:hypothetical protein
MHLAQLLATVGAVASLGWFALAPTPPAAPPAPPAAPTGHYVLVVEGHRELLTITAASAKPDPWGGAPKGFDSAWRLRVEDRAGAPLADVPLDVRPFDVAEGALLRPTRVEGCIVTSPAIGMLVNVPAFAEAARYTFSRPGDAGEAATRVIGVVDAEAVRALAGGRR